MDKEKSRIYNSLKNIFLGIGNQLIVLLLTFISRIVFVRTLGAEYLGINGLFSNVLTILSVAELGLGSAIVYSMYKPLAEGDKKKISALMNYYKHLYNIIAIVVLILGICLIPFLKYLINTTEEIQNINLYYIIFLINTVASYLLASRSVILNADQKLYITKIYTVLVSVVQCILQVLVLVFTKSFTLYLVIQVLGTFTTNLCGVIVTKKLYPYINKKDILETKDKKEIFSNMKSMFFYKIGGVFLNNTDNILISVLVGTIWVGYYSNYLMVISSVETFTNIIFSALTASVGNLIASANKEKQYEIFKTINLICNVMFGFCAVGLQVLFNDFIRIIFGADYVLSMDIVIVIVLYFYIKGILNPIWIYRETTGLFKYTRYIIIITAILNVVLSIILGKICGMFGILLATVISRVLTNIWYEPLVLYRVHFKKKVIDYFKGNLFNFIITIMIIVVCGFITSPIKSVNIATFTLKGIICVIIAGITYYLCYRKTHAFEYLKVNIIDKIIRKFNINIKEK